MKNFIEITNTGAYLRVRFVPFFTNQKLAKITFDNPSILGVTMNILEAERTAFITMLKMRGFTDGGRNDWRFYGKLHMHVTKDFLPEYYLDGRLASDADANAYLDSMGKLIRTVIDSERHYADEVSYLDTYQAIYELLHPETHEYEDQYGEMDSMPDGMQENSNGE